MIPEVKLQPQPPIPSKQNGAAETNPAAANSAQIEMHEAPYSWNCTVVGPEGFSEMFTVRAVSAEGFYARVQRLKANLLDLGYKPAPTLGAAPRAPAANDSPSAPAPLCAIHGTPLQERVGRGGQKFWSCPTKLENGEWCPYRPQKA